MATDSESHPPTTPVERLAATYLAAGGDASAALRFAAAALETLSARLDGVEREVSAGYVRKGRSS